MFLPHACNLYISEQAINTLEFMEGVQTLDSSNDWPATSLNGCEGFLQVGNPVTPLFTTINLQVIINS